MRLPPISSALRTAAFLLLSLAALTSCSPQTQVVEVPVVKPIPVKDPPALLECQQWPKETGPLSKSVQPVAAAIDLIAQGKEAWADCSSKIAAIKKIQDAE